MRSKIHSILISFCAPVMLCLVLPMLQVGMHTLQATALRRGDYGLYITADIAASLIFAFCICYFIWGVQQKGLFHKRTVGIGFILILVIVLFAILGYLIGQYYLFMCMLEHATYPITAVVLYSYLLLSVKKS